MASHELLNETSGLELECKFCPDKCYPDGLGLSLFFHDCMAHHRKRHKCPLCNFAASKKSNWWKHMQKIHGANPGLEVGVCERGVAGKFEAVLRNNSTPVVVLQRIDVKVSVDG